MPTTHTVPVAQEETPHYTVSKHGRDEPVVIIQEGTSEEGLPRVYVHYVNLEKRNDEWLPKSLLQPMPSTSTLTNGPGPSAAPSRKRKRASNTNGSNSASRSHSVESENQGGESQATKILTEEEFDLEQHKKLFNRRNFDQVYFGDWLIKTWYFSPYPLTEGEDPAAESNTNGSHGPAAALPRIPGVTRATIRAHGRTSDLLAGGMGRTVEKTSLYVCDMCFKYMTDASTWDAHKKECSVNHPPGRKVYQRGAHTIWEVDGAKEKLYCQNLSLFGKLFIDIKTLFFDSDNFLFYILTDATSTRDHMLGFFSKEKVSYDDYNLACIVTLPPFQRNGFGGLMIEFSYELSRRAGKVGTPERPLSDLGLRSYLSYWCATLVRFFRKLLEVMPPSAGPNPVITRGAPPDLRGSTANARDATSSLSGDSVTPGSGSYKRRKRNKGWDGEVDEDEDEGEDDWVNDLFVEKLSSLRTFVTTRNPNGGVSIELKIECSLEDIANATNLRVEDTAFALNEMGLLTRWGEGTGEERGDGGDREGEGERKCMSGRPVVVLTRERIEEIYVQRKIKNPCLHLKHVKL